MLEKSHLISFTTIKEADFRTLFVSTILFSYSDAVSSWKYSSNVTFIYSKFRRKTFSSSSFFCNWFITKYSIKYWSYKSIKHVLASNSWLLRFFTWYSQGSTNKIFQPTNHAGPFRPTVLLIPGYSHRIKFFKQYSKSIGISVEPPSGQGIILWCVDPNTIGYNNNINDWAISIKSW